MPILPSLAEFLSLNDAPTSCDLIFVLAGRTERKPYGWQLFQQGLAPRLIFSVGRYEVRQTAQSPIPIPELLELRDQTLPEQRHFWVDFHQGKRITSRAALRKTNTYWELHGLGEYLASMAAPKRIAVVSTSIHLRRVRFCCAKISFFKNSTLSFLPVPEEASSFRRDQWWKQPGQPAYLLNEYTKLAAYSLLHGWR